LNLPKVSTVEAKEPPHTPAGGVGRRSPGGRGRRGGGGARTRGGRQGNRAAALGTPAGTPGGGGGAMRSRGGGRSQSPGVGVAPGELGLRDRNRMKFIGLNILYPRKRCRPWPVVRRAGGDLVVGDLAGVDVVLALGVALRERPLGVHEGEAPPRREAGPPAGGLPTREEEPRWEIMTARRNRGGTGRFCVPQRGRMSNPHGNE